MDSNCAKNRFKIYALLLCCLHFVYCQALSFKGLELVGTVSTPKNDFFGSVTVHMAPERWVCDLGNDLFLEVIPWHSVAQGDYWDPTTEYKIYRKNNDENEFVLLSTKKLTSNWKESALKIVQTERSCVFYAPDGKPVFTEIFMELPSLQPNTELKFYTKTTKDIKSLTDKFESYPERLHIESEFLDEETIESLSSTNPIIGIWRYLDRVTPKDQHVKIGGRYKIAVIPDPENKNSFLLVYIEGATDNNTFWEKGDVKGRLTPTSFENHYNLEWYDKHGISVGQNENSATFEGINLLTLDFPILDTQIRFEKF